MGRDSLTAEPTADNSGYELEIIRSTLEQAPAMFKTFNANSARCMQRMKMTLTKWGTYVETTTSAMCGYYHRYGYAGSAGDDKITCQGCIRAYNKKLKDGSVLICDMAVEK